MEKGSSLIFKDDDIVCVISKGIMSIKRIKFQLNYFIKEQYTHNLNEITNASNAEGLSGSDKMAMNTNKLDEGLMVLRDLNIKFTLQKIRRDIDVPITEEEIDYYIKHHIPSPIQMKLVNGYYTKYFFDFEITFDPHQKQHQHSAEKSLNDLLPKVF